MRPIGYAFEPVKDNDVVSNITDPGDYSEQDYAEDSDIYNVTESGNNSAQKINFIPYINPFAPTDRPAMDAPLTVGNIPNVPQIPDIKVQANDPENSEIDVKDKWGNAYRSSSNGGKEVRYDGGERLSEIGKGDILFDATPPGHPIVNPEGIRMWSGEYQRKPIMIQQDDKRNYKETSHGDDRSGQIIVKSYGAGENGAGAAEVFAVVEPRDWRGRPTGEKPEIKSLEIIDDVTGVNKPLNQY